MSQKVEVPGIGTLEFPDGMSQSDMAAAIQKNYPQIHGRSSPTDRLAKLRADAAAANTPEARAKQYQEIQQQNVASMPWYQKLAAGAGKAVYDTGRGLGEIVGLEKPSDVARSRIQDQALMQSGAGKIGNVLGYVGEAVPAALLAPEAGAAAGAGVGAKLLTGAVSGGAQGYAAPYTSPREHIANTLVGAGLGAAIPGAGAAVSNVMKGLATPEAKALIKEGVKLTPGQMLGGGFKRTEDALTSVPIVGSAVRKAQQRSVQTYSDAAVNRTLSPLGMKLPKNIGSGRDALMYAQNAVSDVYNKTLNKMSASVDGQFRQDLSNIWNKYAQKLGPEKADELNSFISDGILGKMSPSGATKGQIVHEIQSDLGKSARRMMGREMQSDKNLGMAVKDLQNSVKSMMERQNSPELNAAYRKASSAYTNLAKIQKAATYAGSEKGTITPTTLTQAVRSSDIGAKKAYSQGRVALQDLAEAGKNVIPSKVADSGTPARLMEAGLLGGGATGAFMSHPAPLMATLGMGAASHALYSKAGQYLMERALAPKPNPVTNYLAALAQSRLSAPTNALALRAFAPQPVPQIPQQ